MKQLVRAAVIVGVLAACGWALASPAITDAVIHTRIFNDDPNSTVTFGKTWPTSLYIQDSGLNQPTGWANRHNFRLSDDGGASEAVFMNGDAFEFSADVTITGTANVEGGLNLSPWWSKDVDGVFMVNTENHPWLPPGTGGEIAIFGGRLPFYSFTGNYGLLYDKGTTVNLKMQYVPGGLSAAIPGRVKYVLKMGASTYYSPWLAFDQGNPAEDPPYGLWGDLNDARVGGYFMPKVNPGIPGNWGRIEFNNMGYAPIPEPASLALLGLGALAAIRRKR